MSNPLFSTRQIYQQTGTRELKRCTQVHHQYVGGAIAELIDNAREAKASRLDINVEDATLYFTDNGTGMKPRNLSTMLSFGFTTKGSDAESTNNFGIGFKSGSMTIGNEALVLTNDGSVRGLAFLSKGLNPQGAGVLLRVPFVFWNADGSPATQTNPLPASPATTAQQPIESNPETLGILSDIFQAKNTPIRTFKQLRGEFEQLDAFAKEHPNDAKPRKTVGGTRVIIFALPTSGPQSLKFPEEDAEDDEADIIIRRGHEANEEEGTESAITFTRQDRSPPFLRGVDVPIDYSLRRYLEVMYTPDCRMRITLLGKPVKYIDLLDPQYVVNQRKYQFQLPALTDSPGYSDDKVDLEVTFGFSPEDFENRRFGLFIYWDTNQFKLRGDEHRIAPRLILPYHRVGDQEAATARAITQADFRGVIGVLTVTPRVLRVENGKQKFDQSAADQDIGNLASNYKECMDTLGDLLKQYILDKREDNAKLLARWSDMFKKQLYWNCPCWARFTKTEWWPSQLLNRYDRTLGSEAARKEKDANNHAMNLILYENEKTHQAYGWLSVDCLRPFNPKKDPNSRPLKEARYAGAIKEATKKHKELIGDEEEHLAECCKCKQVRRYRGEPYTKAYECAMGWFALPSLSRFTLCDPDSAPEIPAERAEFNAEKGLGRTPLAPADTQAQAPSARAARAQAQAPSTSTARAQAQAPSTSAAQPEQSGSNGVGKQPKRAAAEATASAEEESEVAEMDLAALVRGGKKIGKGRGSTVYQVEHAGKARVVKVWEGSGASADERQRLEKALRAVEKLSKSKHCLQVLGKQSKRAPLAVLMDKYEGSMEEALEWAEVSLVEMLLMALQVCRGMRAGSNKSLAHGALSLRNILVRWGGQEGFHAVVADYGLWAVTPSRHTPRPPRSLYAARELLDPAQPQPPTQSTDVVAYGWVLVQMVAGRASSWSELDPEAAVGKILRGERDTDLLTAASNKHKGVGELIRDCLENEPARRPTFAAIEEMLLGAIEGTPLVVGRTIKQWRKKRQDSSIVYRVLDDRNVRELAREQAMLPYKPQSKIRENDLGDVKRALNLTFHIRHGQVWEGRTAYTSFSASREWILWYVQKKHWLHTKADKHHEPPPRSRKYKAYPWVAIDLDKVPEEQVSVIDLSSKQLIEACPQASRLAQISKCYAFSAKEIIIVGPVPPEAVVERFEVDPQGRFGQKFLAAGVERQSDCLGWKPGPTTDRFEPFHQWRWEFSQSEAGKDLEGLWAECQAAARSNVQWPVPRGYDPPSGAVSAAKKVAVGVKGGSISGRQEGVKVKMEKEDGRNGEKKRKEPGASDSPRQAAAKRNRSESDEEPTSTAQVKRGRLGGVGSSVKQAQPAEATSGQRRVYTCKYCGEPKKGHVCKVQPATATSAAKSSQGQTPPLSSGAASGAAAAGGGGWGSGASGVVGGQEGAADEGWRLLVHPASNKPYWINIYTQQRYEPAQ